MRKLGLLLIALFVFLLASCDGNRGFRIYKDEIEKTLEATEQILDAAGYQKINVDIDWKSKEIIKVEEEDKVVYYYKVEYVIETKASDNIYGREDEQKEIEMVVYFKWHDELTYYTTITEETYNTAKNNKI